MLGCGDIDICTRMDPSDARKRNQRKVPAMGALRLLGNSSNHVFGDDWGRYCATQAVVAPNNGRNCSAGPASAGQYAISSAAVAGMTAEFFSGIGAQDRTFGADSSVWN